MAEINWDDFRPVGAAPKQDEQDVDWGQFTPVGSAKNGQGQGDGILRKTGDLGLSLLSGAVAVPEAAVGLADLASGGRAGKFLENEGGSFGFRPKEAKEAIQGWQSDSLNKARQDFAEADGVTGKVVTALQNPSLISNAVAESLPLMGAMMVTGGSAGAAAAGGATRLATAAPTVARGLNAVAKAAPYIGEGLAGAGSAAEQIRQESKDGLLTGKQSALAAASGVGTVLLGAVGNKAAGLLGIGDLDVVGAQAVAKGLGAKIASESAEKATKAGLAKRLVGGAISEGLLEELPQSAQEQILQNLATGKDWREGLTDAAVMGAITGGVMGGGFNLFHSGGQAENTTDEKPQPQGLGLRQLGYSPDAGAMAVFPDGTVALNSEQELERRYRPQEATKPSERMGLNPTDGPNSAAAVVAVDSTPTQSAINPIPVVDTGSDDLTLNTPQARSTGVANTGAIGKSGNAVVLQNRDRSTAASVAQMNAIASSPDYLRTGASRTMDTGAPVVFGDLPAGAVTGRTEMVADGRGERIQTQYAVVDAGDVLTSNHADGSPIAEYAAGAPGKLRAVAGNARTAGLAEAYRRNTAGTYKQELAQDATSLGIDPAAVAAMQSPILVRIMDAADVTADIGDRSNVAGTARLSAVEEAANDARRVDIGGIVFDANGMPSTQSVLGFIHSMPESERSNMLNADGTPTRQAIDRIMAATFKQAYDSDALVQLYAQATDPQARTVMSALADAAGAMSALDGAGEFDIRAAVADAAGMAVNAARRGLKLSDVVRESDIDVSPEAFVVAQFLADNIRSGKRMAEGLRAWAQLAQQQLAIERDNASQGGLFDARPTLTREQLLQGLGNGNTATAETSPDAGGPESAAEGAQRPEAEPGRNGRGATNGAERAEPATGTKQPRSGQQERLTDEAARPKGWRNNMPGAAKVARDLGIDPRQHKTVASLVAAIDAADQQAGLQTKAPASVPTVEDKAPGPQPSQTEKARSEKAAPPADASGKTQADRIEDFGEKIGGARKDVWAGFKDSLNAVKNADIAAQPLSKIWPVPDYQKLIDDGISAENVAMIRALRDEIPVKPRASWKVKRWAQQVQALRDFANDVLNGTYTLQQIKDMAGSKAVLGKVFGRIDLYQAVGHGQSLQGVNLAFHHYTIYKGKENVSLWVVEQDVKATAWSNWPRELATGETKEAAIAAFKKKLATLDINTPDKKETSFEIYSRRGENGYWIGKKVGRNPIFLEGPFDSVKEARAYKDANNAKLVEKLEQAKQIPNERRETNEPRVGVDMRNGQDVTPQMFGDTFGFRGVEFGNWVEQGRRQQDLNEAFDALMDMAAILNVPPRALSLNGELGIAFGARGKGGKNSAKAHYEPGFVAINLTKREGAGSLGHEWWHALDNYFSRMRDKGQGMMTEALDVSLSSKGSRFEMNSDKVRQEMIVAFGDVVRTIRQTAIQARSAKLDVKRSKEYWTTQPEMSARAFESYLISKLQDQNASNDYLANIVSPETWKAAEALGFELDGSYPYPSAGEIPAIRSAFDRFFQTVETKETDQGVALFSQQTKAESRTSDNAANQGARDGQQQTASGIPTGLPAASDADSRDLERRINEWIGSSRWRAHRLGTVSLPLELRAALDRFADATGTRVVLFRNLTPGIEDFNGVNFRDGRVFINETSQHPATLTASHEWVHNLKRTHPQLYQQLEDEVRRQGRIPEWHKRNVREEGMDRGRDHAVEELTAAAVSDAMTDPAFLQRLAERDHGMFRRVARAFLDFLNTLTSGWRDQGSNSYLRDVEAFRDKLADVLAAYESNSAGPGSAETLKSAWANFITETKTPITSVPTGATGNSGAFDGRNADIRFSRSQETQQAYEARIDALFAGDKPSARGTRVLDKSDVLDLLGASKGGIHLVEGKVVAGQDNHPFMTAQQWKQVPQWLDNPAMVFESDTVAGRLVFIGPELVNESPVRMIVDPRPEGDGVNLLINAYDAQVNPFSRWARDGLLRYYDKQKAPNVAGSFQPQLTGLPGSGGRKKILTEKNLAGYRKEQMADGSPKFSRPLSGPQALKDANGLLRLEMRAGIDGNNPRRVMKAARQAVASLQDVRQRSGSPTEKRLLSAEIEGMLALERSIIGSMRMRAENSAVNGMLDKGPQKLSTLMAAIASATKTPDIAELAQHIASVAGDVTVDRARNDSGTMGKYSTVQRKITLARGANGISANTLLHEGVHAATAHALIERPLLRRRAQALLDHAIAKNPSIKAEYGSRDVFEFVAEAMTNAGFQAKLRSVSPTSTLEGKSLWQNFVSMVRKALALPEKHQSALDQVMTLTGELMLEQQRGTDRKGASGPDLNYSVDRDTDAKAPPENTRFDDFVYKMQNKQIDLKRITEWIEKTFGKISDDVNAYLKETLFKGRAAARTKEFAHNELEPLMRLIASSDLSIGDVEEFLHARHAKEANRVIAQRNPDTPELADGGSGMKNAEADQYFAKLDPATRAKLEAVAKQVDTIIEGTRQLYVEYGLEDQDTVDGWKELFKHYIPLMREGKAGGRGIGQGFSVRGKETKGRTGSLRKVVDVLANIVQERERAITRGEKNIVATALVGLVKEHPIKGFWSIQTQPPKTEVFDPRLGKVVQRIDPLYRSRENVLVAKVRGADGRISEVSIEFDEDNPRALRMAQSMKNLDAQSLEGLLGISAKITRYFSAINTQYNPLFGPVNLLRDVQSALLNLSGTPLAGQQAKIAADTAAALADVFKDMRRIRDGKAASTKWGKLLRQFELDGGTTGYMDMFKTSADRAQALEKMLNPDHWMESGAGKLLTANGTLKVPARAVQGGFGAMLNWLEDYNNAMENSTRLAVYSAAINQGMSRVQAAGLAKNITVNFNRKGQVAQQMGAMYAFFNAAVQGTARIGQLLFTMDGGDIKTLRLSKAGKTIVYGGLVLGVLQALALSAAGLDDEEPPEFVRERSLVIPTGNGKYVTIPMPLGYHVIPGVSRHLTEWALGGFERTPKRLASMVGMFSDAFNPIVNAGLSMQTLAPTALDPLVALTENKDFTGRAIARKSRNSAEPGHTQGKDTATWVAKTVSEAVNWITGGNEYKAGVFSPTPDQIDYLIGQATGGVGRELSKAQQTISAMATGEELPPHKIPGISRFYGDTNSQSAHASRFYRTLERVNELETEVNGLRKDGRTLDAIRLMRGSPYGRLIQPANQAERQLVLLRKAKREAMARGDSVSVKVREEQMTTVMRRLTSLAGSEQ